MGFTKLGITFSACRTTGKHTALPAAVAPLSPLGTTVEPTPLAAAAMSDAQARLSFCAPNTAFHHTPLPSAMFDAEFPLAPSGVATPRSVAAPPPPAMCYA
ncbi:hypothetical protein L1887_25289 [Cichorium endivia]|nr:hypothetical protein L1887_25289 [Cichorium endivia]